MLHTHVVTLKGNGSLVKELIDATLVRLFAIRKETGEKLETGYFIQRFIAG